MHVPTKGQSLGLETVKSLTCDERCDFGRKKLTIECTKCNYASLNDFIDKAMNKKTCLVTSFVRSFDEWEYCVGNNVKLAENDWKRVYDANGNLANPANNFYFDCTSPFSLYLQFIEVCHRVFFLSQFRFTSNWFSLVWWCLHLCVYVYRLMILSAAHTKQQNTSALATGIHRMAFSNVCNFLKCKIGLKEIEQKHYSSFISAKTLLLKRINIKASCLPFSQFPFEVVTPQVVVIVFILYFVNAIQPKAKQKISRTKSGIDTNEKKKNRNFKLLKELGGIECKRESTACREWK